MDTMNYGGHADKARLSARHGSKNFGESRVLQKAICALGAREVADARTSANAGVAAHRMTTN